MIACFITDIEENELTVEGDSFVHLTSALRVKEGEEVLVLNGKGSKKKTVVESIGKKKIVLTGGKLEIVQRKLKLDLLLSPPKREALNDCLRFACEIGIRTIYLFDSEFGQNKKIDLERLDKILKSSLVQSNNPYLPEVKNISSDLDLGIDYEKVFLFHLDESVEQGSDQLNKAGEYLLALGPEGGFSEGDLGMLKANFRHTERVTIGTEIMRTPTALCVASGWLISKL